MSNEIAPITTHDVESRIIMVRGQQVILDCDVLYKLTKRKWRNWRENLLLVTGLRSKILIANPSVIKLDTCQRHLQKEVSICWQPSSSHLVQHRPLLPLLILSLKSEQWHVHNRIHCRLCLTVTDGWHFHKKNEAQQLRDEMKNQIFTKLGLPLLRISTTDTVNQETIKQLLFACPGFAGARPSAWKQKHPWILRFWLQSSRQSNFKGCFLRFGPSVKTGR